MSVLAFNDAWVMSAWGKANGIKGDDIVSTLSMQLGGAWALKRIESVCSKG